LHQAAQHVTTAAANQAAVGVLLDYSPNRRDLIGDCLAFDTCGRGRRGCRANVLSYYTQQLLVELGVLEVSFKPKRSELLDGW
jgi:hypothetical protein